MTIVTRQSSPRTGTECPADCTNSSTTSNNSNNNNNDEDKRTSLSSKKKMKISNKKKANSEIGPNIPNRLANLDGLKSVMCETTNLTPPAKSASSAAVLDATATLGNVNASGGDICDLLPTGEGDVEGVKKIVKKNPKAKLKNGSGPVKEDLVACRKSKRLLNKHSRFDKSKYGTLANTRNRLGRTVELLNPLENLDRECSLTQVMFLGSLGLQPTFCNTTPKDPVGTLKRLCIRELIRQKRSILESNELHFRSQKRRRDTTEDEDEDTTFLEGVTPNINSKLTENTSPQDCVSDAQNINISNTFDDNADETQMFENFEKHMLSMLENLPGTDDTSKSITLESIKDCVRKILNVGSKCTIKGPSVSTEIQDLISQWHEEHPVSKDKDGDDDMDKWLNWEDHIISIIQSSPSSMENDNERLNNLDKTTEVSHSKLIPEGSIPSGSGSKSAHGCSTANPSP